MTLLDRSKGAAPLYAQLESVLKNKIENGEFKKGDVFLSEKQLQEEYEVSRVTVRQAMGNLVNMGYIRSARGVGTVVVFDKIDENLKQVVSFSEEMKRHGIEMNTSYCKIEKILFPSGFADGTGFEAGEECYRLVRVRCVKKLPIVYSVTYLNGRMELPLDEKHYEESLYEFLRESCGIHAVKGKDTFEAVSADEKTASFLELDVGEPLFKRTRKTFDENGGVIEYTVCYYPGDRYKYSVEL